MLCKSVTHCTEYEFRSHQLRWGDQDAHYKYLFKTKNKLPMTDLCQKHDCSWKFVSYIVHASTEMEDCMEVPGC